MLLAISRSEAALFVVVQVSDARDDATNTNARAIIFTTIPVNKLKIYWAKKGIHQP